MSATSTETGHSRPASANSKNKEIPRGPVETDPQDKKAERSVGKSAHSPSVRSTHPEKFNSSDEMQNVADKSAHSTPAPSKSPKRSVIGSDGESPRESDEQRETPKSEPSK